MEQSTLSPDVEQRRQSYDHHAAMAWPAFPVMQPENGAHHHFQAQRHDAIFELGTLHSDESFVQGGPSWPMADPSGSCTPTAPFDGTLHAVDNTGPQPSHIATHNPLSQSYGGLRLDPTPDFGAQAPLNSPPAPRGWISPHQDAADDASHMISNQNPRSPPFVGIAALRRDGIRKKNARFEIPPDRNLQTIDHLINQTSDEQEIKELKQQKRLLRNRQAALDSRQRKKQHTERLEEEKKHYTVVLNEMEEELAQVRIQETQAKAAWAEQRHQYEQIIERLVVEKEETIRSHTVETGDLRKRNAVLMDQLQRLEHTNISAAPSSAGYSAGVTELDQFALDSSPWETFSTNDFGLEGEVSGDHVGQLASGNPLDARDDEKPATASLVFMLLLCGAWMASRASTNSPPKIPAIPAELKAASTSVLETLYQDTGIPLAGSSIKAEPSSETRLARRANLDATEPVSISRSLDVLHRQLAAPSKAQLHEHAFSLTPQQYNDLASDETFQHATDPALSVHFVSQHPPHHFVHSQAGREGQTSSLLLNKVPRQVLEDFAQMVADTKTTN